MEAAASSEEISVEDGIAVGTSHDRGRTTAVQDAGEMARARCWTPSRLPRPWTPGASRVHVVVDDETGNIMTVTKGWSASMDHDDMR